MSVFQRSLLRTPLPAAMNEVSQYQGPRPRLDPGTIPRSMRAMQYQTRIDGFLGGDSREPYAPFCGLAKAFLWSGFRAVLGHI